MAEVVLKNLVKVFAEKGGGTRAVDDVSLAVADREFMVLVGPSGCGKSTTLRLLAGLEEATSGTISIGGTVVNEVPPKDRDIAMVFQNYALYPHMSVRENMGFGLKLRGIDRKEIDRRVGEAAALLGLEALLDRRPKALSGGQRQRVAVGRAIVRQPKVFLFDEPLSNLDARMRVSMRAEISRLHARLGATMVYVTHDQVEAMTMGTRICVMKDGRVMQVADPITLYNQPANLFVAGFIGSPSMNFFRGTIREEGGRLLFEETNTGMADTRRASAGRTPVGEPPPLEAPILLPLDARLAHLAQREITLGLRPEHLSEPTRETPSGQVIRARIEIAEPLGAETYVHCTTGATRFVARMRPTSLYKPGDMASVAVDMAGAHFFDPETGNALSASEGGARCP